MSEILWWKVISRRTLAFFTAGEKLVQQDNGEVIDKEMVGSVEKEIELIGDDFIRKNYQEQMRAFYDGNEMKRREIAELQKRIRELQKGME